MLTDSQIVRLLDIANAGCHKGMVMEARTIYEGILAVLPGHAPALIGRALSHIVIGEYGQAETILRSEVLSENPDDPEGRVMLGLCLFLADKKDEAEEILQPLAEEEHSSAELAKSLLEQIRQA
ncbi:tetratricopeptide repeat protein [Mailhella massiliensis]|uniref:tetratricopeptide repeat protein n=1 Tax=Mailhella massiliensis TaxID=1903261 RepID=UPI00097DD967|nr:tetratricopeptide repeat protein [Mailhella massiliensis]